VIEMVGVSKTFPDGGVGVRDIDVHIARGEFVFLTGPSGAGKSTFLRLVNRELVPTRGRVVVDGENVVRMRQGEVPRLRRKLGVVFQDFKLLPDRTVYDNVAFAMVVTGAHRHDIQKRVPEVLALVGLEHKQQSYPRQLSGGEQQRAAIARAIANNPVLVLADEPTGNLDPDTSWNIIQLLLHVNRWGSTVVVATHDEPIVDAVRQRVITLHGGTIVRDEIRGLYAHEA